MAKSQISDEYRVKLAELKGSFSAQAKELAVPVVVDIVSGLTGWWLGKQMGRASLAVGFAAYAGGKVHSLHESIKREELRIGVYDEQTRPALSGLNPLYNNENRVYHGESPLVALGMGMMLGGAFSEKKPDPNNPNPQPLGAVEKAKSAFSEIAEDLKYRLYLDKIFKGEQKQDEKKQEEKPVSGITDVDVFIAGNKLTQDLDMSKLDKLDESIEQAAVDFDSKRTTGISGYDSPAVRVADAYAETDEEVSGVYSRIM